MKKALFIILGCVGISLLIGSVAVLYPRVIRQMGIMRTGDTLGQLSLLVPERFVTQDEKWPLVRQDMLVAFKTQHPCAPVEGDHILDAWGTPIQILSSGNEEKHSRF